MAEWIFPASEKYYRIDDAFRELKILDWRQNSLSTNVAVGDIVYIYASSPRSEIRWQCRVRKTHKNPGTIDDGRYSVPPVSAGHYEPGDCIELEAEKRLDLGPLLSYKTLAAHGLKSRLMGPTLLKPGPLADYIHSIVDAPDTDILLRRAAEKMPEDELAAAAGKASKGPVREVTSTVKQYVRNAFIAEYAKRRANGICQLCGMKAPFEDETGRPYLESHHIEWLSQGGKDSIDNTVAICPNCHRKMHILGLPEDVEKLKKANARVRKNNRTGID